MILWPNQMTMAFAPGSSRTMSCTCGTGASTNWRRSARWSASSLNCGTMPRLPQAPSARRRTSRSRPMSLTSATTSARMALWGPMWGEHLDFVMAENTYRVPESGAESPHLLLPRGKFTAWYRLASGFTSRAPAWICPSILVPRQLAGQERTGYYLLMFLEAYANGGRWAYNWWPGVDDRARYSATVPALLKEYIEFITAHRQCFELAETGSELAILYLDTSVSLRPQAHQKYLALAQALAETGYQYDVLYVG